MVVGETVKLMYVDQDRGSLNADKTVFEELSGGAEEISLGTRTVNSRAYCSWYNFKSADQQKKVGTLSGGERNRLQLAKTLTSGGNVLMLDEPTNDLDVTTLRALEEAIMSWNGVTMCISHDRWFLNKIATHILAYEGRLEGDVLRGLVRRVRGTPQGAHGGARSQPRSSTSPCPCDEIEG